MQQKWPHSERLPTKPKKNSHEFCESKTHDKTFCRRKRNNINKVKENKKNFYYTVRINPNIKPVNFELLVDCEATTRNINYEHKFIKFEDNFDPNEHFTELANGSRNNIALKKRTVKLILRDMKGFETQHVFK